MSEPTAPTLRVATYNVHGCVGLDRRLSESRIAEVIASLSADVVGLQELDLNRRRSAGADQAALIAGQLGWHYVFQAAMRREDEEYGDAILSRFPLKGHRFLELPGDGAWYCREKRVAIWAEAETNLGPVQIINTHFGLGRAERYGQAEFLADLIKKDESAGPLLLLGDFNSLPGSRALIPFHNHLRSVRALLPSAGPCRTFPTRLPSIAVDHIFVNEKLAPTSLSVPRTAKGRVASDHYPLMAELVRSSP